MDRQWIDQVVAQLGKRYRAASGGAECVLEHRSGKVEFRATPVRLGTGDEGRGLTLTVDVRIPKGEPESAAEPLVVAFEAGSMTPRGFARIQDETAAMTNQAGATSGFARTLLYALPDGDPALVATHIRAVIESVDLPIILGIHEEEHVVARDPRPPPPRPATSPADQLEPLRFRLESGLTHDLSLVVDQNTRTLTVMRRRFVSTQQIGDPVKLAHLQSIGVRPCQTGAALVAHRRDGGQVVLVESAGGPEFTATAKRFAEKVRIPFGSI